MEYTELAEAALSRLSLLCAWVFGCARWDRRHDSVPRQRHGHDHDRRGGCDPRRERVRGADVRALHGGAHRRLRFRPHILSAAVAR